MFMPLINKIDFEICQKKRNLNEKAPKSDLKLSV